MPLEKDPKKKPKNGTIEVGELGESGTNKWGGFIDEEYNRYLSGRDAMRVYDEMRKADSTVGAGLLAIKNPLRRAKWYIEPVSTEDPIEIEKAAFIEWNLKEGMETPWDDFLRQALLYLDFGVLPFEKVWDVLMYEGKSRIGIRKLAPRMPKSILEWEVTINGAKMPGIRQQAMQKVGADIQIPMDKLLVFVLDKEGDNWWGTSILRRAYKNWDMKSKLEEVDAMAHERQGLGVPFAIIPDAMTDQDKKTARNILKNFRAHDEQYLIMTEKVKVEFLDMHANTTKDPSNSLQYHSRQILLSMLVQFLQLGSKEGSSGSWALSADHSELFLQSIEGIAQNLCDTINRFLIPQLVDANYPGSERYPRLVFSDIKRTDVAGLASAYKTLGEAGGLKPIRGDEKYMRSIMNLPERTPEDDAYDEKIQAEKDKVAAAIAGLGPAGADPTKDPKADPKKEKDQKPIPVEAAELDDFYFGEAAAVINNRFIGSIMEKATEEERAALKKKGLRFNDFEDKAPRPLTFAERKVNFDMLQKNLERYQAEIEERLKGITAKQKEDILAQVKRAVEANDVSALDGIKVKYKGEVATAIAEIQKTMFEIGKKSASGEMGVDVPATKQEIMAALKMNNGTLVDKLSSDMENDVKATVTQQMARKGGSITSTAAADAVAAASLVLDKTVDRAVRVITSVTTTGAVNMGRSSVFMRYPEKVYAMQYSAILDIRTTDHCRSLDGRIVPPGSSQYYDFSPPQHYNCRSMWVEILNDEAYKPDITGIPSSLHASSSVDDYVPPKKPILWKDSPAIKVVEDELAERKAKLAELEKAGTYPNRQDSHRRRIAELEKSLQDVRETLFVEYLLESVHG